MSHFYHLLPGFDPDGDESAPADTPLNWRAMEDRMGMTLTTGSVTLTKDDSNLIGISIGGGAPLCPCLYVVQVFDNTAAGKDGTLQSGDELIGVNGTSVKGRTKVEVARIIQAVKGDVTVSYNKLHADPKQGKSLDIILKKVKHRLVENMSASTADALGLSRAILCNDSLVKRLEELERTEKMYHGVVEHLKKVLRAFFDLCRIHKAFGDTFSVIGAREPQPRASEVFTSFGDAHRIMEKNGVKLLRTLKPILSDLGTYLHKAIPDTRLTIQKYLDTKFEYLSFCLKVKEMDDEEYSYAALQEPMYRVETGNYEYRLVLRCRQDARARFARLRSDVLVKLELLDQKHVQDIVYQLQRLISGFASYHSECYDLMKEHQYFPIEVDLSRSAFQYGTPSTFQQDGLDEEGLDEDDDHLLEVAEEVTEANKPTPVEPEQDLLGSF
ncbi:LOW QUALITY PROTEIN: PRKCA-binding protein-like [Pollicipes pollicipes]|uniref:LOW QUALITY PROTEIN: PRKCA-binding protein-like n=1 Tax=Pollicipes pollicipes TaxID=41117 RepID=UPI001884CC41|nr:LOW QUALITY PROTEIN: PRKCA-binding protein-like [Pollicipes pollicipes]